MTSRQVSVRLNEAELAIVDVLAKGGSRTRWFREALAEEVELRIRTNELQIAAFKIATANESERDEGSLLRVRHLQEFVAKLQDENLTLCKSENE